MQSLAAEQAAAGGLPADLFGDETLSGRVIVGVHAEDDALELVGLDFSVSDAGVPSAAPTRLAQGLPEDTLAAVSASGVGDRAVAYWETLQQSGAFPEGEDPFTGLDLALPEDLRTIFGTDLVVAAFGDIEAPRFGARVVTEDGQRAARIVNELLTMPEVGVQTSPARVDDGYGFGTDDDTAVALGSDDGGLGDSERFQDAVADPGTASAIGYVDLAAVVEQVVAQGGEAGEEAARYAAVDVLGFSAASTDEGSRVVVRITTR